MCVTCKQEFQSSAAAHKFLNRMGWRKCFVYRCNRCYGFHVTRQHQFHPKQRAERRRLERW